MIDNRTEEQRKTDTERIEREIAAQQSADNHIFSLTCMGSIIAIGTFIHACNSEPKSRFEENEKRYLYDIGGGINLIDTNKDSRADIYIYEGAAPRGRFHRERAPTKEEQELFDKAYGTYLNQRRTE